MRQQNAIPCSLMIFVTGLLFFALTQGDAMAEENTPPQEYGGAFSQDEETAPENRWAFLVDLEPTTAATKPQRLLAIQSWQRMMAQLGIPANHTFVVSVSKGQTPADCLQSLNTLERAIHHTQTDFKGMKLCQKAGTPVEVHLYVNADEATVQSLLEKKPFDAGDADNDGLEVKHAERLLFVLNSVDGGGRKLQSLSESFQQAVQTLEAPAETKRFTHCVFCVTNQQFDKFARPGRGKQGDELDFFELLWEGLDGRSMLKHKKELNGKVALSALYEYLLAEQKPQKILGSLSKNQSFYLSARNVTPEIPVSLMERTRNVFTLAEFRAERDSAEKRARMMRSLTQTTTE